MRGFFSAARCMLKGHCFHQLPNVVVPVTHGKYVALPAMLGEEIVTKATYVVRQCCFCGMEGKTKNNYIDYPHITYPFSIVSSSTVSSDIIGVGGMGGSNILNLKEDEWNS